jgi:hypothetical protein
VIDELVSGVDRQLDALLARQLQRLEVLDVLAADVDVFMISERFLPCR